MFVQCMLMIVASSLLVTAKPQQNLAMLAQELQATTLVQLLQTAGLADTIASGGPFTVFAPTNEAFSKLPKETLLSLLTDTNKLANVLKAHVVSGRILQSDVSNEAVLDTLSGQKIRANVYSHTITISGVKVSAFDKMASNGVIHVIDNVIMPASRDIVGLVAGNSDFSTLLTAVQTAGLADALKGGPFTVFAPDNSAFEKLGSTVIQKLLKNKDILEKILKYHVVQGTAYSAGLQSGLVSTLAGNKLYLRKSGGSVRVNLSHVKNADISVTNGVVHVIDSVLIPSSAWLQLLG